MQEKLVSIIIPIYNVKDYLKRCIGSVQSQSHSNIEIILVDDGSLDGSSEICDHYQSIDNRVKVIHQKNGGISAARNSGLLLSNGGYLAFVDGDDYLHEDFIKTLLTCALENNADVSVCTFIRVYGDREVITNKFVQKCSFTNIEALKDLFSYPSMCDIIIWNKLYKKSLFIDNNIIFPEGKIHEDTFTSYKLLYAANKIVFTNSPLYYYLQRRGSIMNSNFNMNNFDMIEAVEETVVWVDEFEPSLSKIVRAYKLRFQLMLLNRITDAKVADSTVWKKLSKNILDDSLETMENKYVSKKHKLLIKILRIGKIPYTISRKIYLLKKETI